MHTSQTTMSALQTLLLQQSLAVLATQGEQHPYTSLVAFAATDDLRHLLFVTSRTTTKYQNLLRKHDIALLIDDRTTSNQDFKAGIALTVLGQALELTATQHAAHLPTFLKKHPSLEAFTRTPSTALFTVEVQRYLLVTQFQQVVEININELS